MNSYKQSLYVGVIRVLANLLMVGAVFLAMRQASRALVWPSEAVFCLVFFGITIPVWILAAFVTKIIRRLYPAEKLSLVNLPGQGEKLVSWRVGDQAGRLSIRQNIS